MMNNRLNGFNSARFAFIRLLFGVTITKKREHILGEMRPKERMETEESVPFAVSLRFSQL